MANRIRIILDLSSRDMEGKIKRILSSSARKIATDIDKSAVKYLRFTMRNIQMLARELAPHATGSLRDSINISYDVDRTISGARGRKFRPGELIGSIKLSMTAGHSGLQEFGHAGGYRWTIQKSAGSGQTIEDWLTMKGYNPKQHPRRNSPQAVIWVRRVKDLGGNTKFLRGRILGQAFNILWPSIKGGLRSVIRENRRLNETIIA